MNYQSVKAWLKAHGYEPPVKRKKAVVPSKAGKLKWPVPETAAQFLKMACGTASYVWLCKAAEGDVVAIGMAFSWLESPQGGGYWYDRRTGNVPLSPDDLAWLKALLKNHIKVFGRQG